MSTIRIGDEERQLSDADAQWIQQQVAGRRRDGVDPCVRVHIRVSGADVAMQTKNCPSQPGAHREATTLESRLLKLWDKHHLNDANYSVGNLIAALQQIRRET